MTTHAEMLRWLVVALLRAALGLLAFCLIILVLYVLARVIGLGVARSWWQVTGSSKADRTIARLFGTGEEQREEKKEEGEEDG